jgi:hypothetical protein
MFETNHFTTRKECKVLYAVTCLLCNAIRSFLDSVVSTISCSVIIWFMCNDSISNNFFYNKTLKIYHSIIYTINIINSIALLVRMHIYFTMQWNSFLSISLWLTQMASPFPHSFQGTPSPFHKACWSVRHGWCSSWEKNSSLCSKGHLPGDGQHW